MRADETLPLVEKSLKSRAVATGILKRNAPLPNRNLKAEHLATHHQNIKINIQRRETHATIRKTFLLVLGAGGAIPFFGQAAVNLKTSLQDPRVNAPLGNDPVRLSSAKYRTIGTNIPFNAEVFEGAEEWVVAGIAAIIDRDSAELTKKGISLPFELTGAYIASKGFLVPMEDATAMNKTFAILLQILPTSLLGSIGFCALIRTGVGGFSDGLKIWSWSQPIINGINHVFPKDWEIKVTEAEFLTNQVRSLLSNIDIKRRRELVVSIKQIINGKTPVTHYHALALSIILPQILTQQDDFLTKKINPWRFFFPRLPVKPKYEDLSEEQALLLTAFIYDLCFEQKLPLSHLANFGIAILLTFIQIPSLLGIAFAGQNSLEEISFPESLAMLTHVILYGMLFRFGWNILNDVFKHARGPTFVYEGYRYKAILMTVIISFLTVFVSGSYVGSSSVMLDVLLRGIFKATLLSFYQWFTLCVSSTVTSNGLACFSNLSSFHNSASLAKGNPELLDAEVANDIVNTLAAMSPKILTYASAREHFKHHLTQLPKPPEHVRERAAFNNIN